MKLIKINAPADILAIRQAYFSFDCPSNIGILMHEFRIDGQSVGYIATEDYNTVGGPHVHIHEGFKNKAFLTKVKWILNHVYYPLMKGLGKEFLVTNCEKDDTGTQWLLESEGFELKHIVVAEKVL